MTRCAYTRYGLQCGSAALRNGYCALHSFAWAPQEHARATDAETSHAAAISVQGEAKVLMGRILVNLRQQGPATFSEIAQRMRLDPGQVWKRLSDLKNAGEIADSGITRSGPSRRQQTVWRAL